MGPDTESQKVEDRGKTKKSRSLFWAGPGKCLKTKKTDASCR